ncbi:MAG: hypothetical protein OEW05_04405 [Candidatus Aminicenantes bacterium]|nr:hypothetical protein [Candidatus Aminicenantes bacterium]
MNRHPLVAKTAALGLFLFVILAAADLRPCTLAVCSGKATRDGRPLMWKNRDTSKVANKVLFFSGPKYKFLGLVDSDNVREDEVYGGLNETGFAIMNSQADDLATPKKAGDGNGALMKLALGECATVREFEALLAREKGKFDLAANFGVIDAAGGACFFETGSASFVKFDAADPRVAPFGYLVRTNFAFTSPDLLKGGGFIRFERISHIFERGRGENRLDVKFILREASRDLIHEKLVSNPWTKELPADPAAPLYINTNDTINRNSSVSALVFDGAPAPASAHLATMWVLLGQPVTAVALPLWAGAGEVPAALTGPKTAPLNDLSRAIVAYLYPDRRGRMPQYLNVNRLRTYGGEGVLTKIVHIEDDVLARTADQIVEWEKTRPARPDVAGFQEKLASWAYESLKTAFPFLD